MAFRSVVALVLFVFFFSSTCSAVKVSDFGCFPLLPKRIFVTDGSMNHFGLVINAVKNYRLLGGNPDNFYVLTYDQGTTDFLESVGVNTFFFPELTQKIAVEDRELKCSYIVHKEFMSVIMELKIQLWLELSKNGIQFVIFDSDTVFYQHPDFFNETFNEGADIIPGYFLGLNLVEYTAHVVQTDYILDGVAAGKFELNLSPTAVVSPTKMYPVLDRMFSIIRAERAARCERWGGGGGKCSQMSSCIALGSGGG